MKTPSSGFPSNVTLLLPDRLLNPASSSLPHVADFNGIRHGWDLRDPQKAYRAIVRPLLAHQQKESELILSDFGILEVLLHKGPQPVNVLGPKVGLNPGSISVAVDRLYECGLVNREESADDRRIRLVSLTTEGKKLISAAFRRHAELIETLFSVLSPDDQTQLQTLLKKLGRHAESVSSSLKP